MVELEMLPLLPTTIRHQLHRHQLLPHRRFYIRLNVPLFVAFLDFFVFTYKLFLCHNFILYNFQLIVFVDTNESNNNCLALNTLIMYFVSSLNK